MCYTFTKSISRNFNFHPDFHVFCKYYRYVDTILLELIRNFYDYRIKNYVAFQVNKKNHVCNSLKHKLMITIKFSTNNLIE